MAQSARIAPLTVDNEVVGTITVIEDVTERVVSERELRSQIAAAERARAVAEDASKLKDEFLATLSHEIRTPLNAVLGWARILRTQGATKSREHALEVIERNATVQLRLVEDLLDMARVISGKLRLDVKPLAIETLVTAAIEVVEPAAAAKTIRDPRRVRRGSPARQRRRRPLAAGHLERDVECREVHARAAAASTCGWRERMAASS